MKRSCFLERLFKDAMFMLALNFLHICAYIYIYTCLYTSVYTHTHTHICIFMYIYVCVYIHLHTYFRNYNKLHWFPFAFNVLSSLKTDDIKGMGVKLYCFKCN